MGPEAAAFTTETATTDVKMVGLRERPSVPAIHAPELEAKDAAPARGQTVVAFSPIEKIGLEGDRWFRRRIEVQRAGDGPVRSIRADYRLRRNFPVVGQES